MKNDHVYTVGAFGAFGGTVFFNTNEGVFELTGIGNVDMFIYQQTASGSFLSAHAIGRSGFDIPESLVINTASEIFLTGSFSTTVDFDPSSDTNYLISNGSMDIFVAKFNSVTLSMEEVSSDGHQVSLFPNPFGNAVHIRSAHAIKRVSLYDMKGKQLYTKRDIQAPSL